MPATTPSSSTVGSSPPSNAQEPRGPLLVPAQREAEVCARRAQRHTAGGRRGGGALLARLRADARAPGGGGRRDRRVPSPLSERADRLRRDPRARAGVDVSLPGGRVARGGGGRLGRRPAGRS